MTTIKEIEHAVETMRKNGTARTSPGTYRLLKERLAKMRKNIKADATRQEKADALTPEQIEAGQREWQRKWESGEFTAEANAAKARLEAAAPELLAACKDMLAKIERMYPNDWSGTKSQARAAIARAEGRK